ncbi:MAG: Cell division protein FtsA [bacterium ADurb.Bin212]|nr:MAG: Cell division protein FtsA [bacterium ADurb.Bin212]
MSKESISVGLDIGSTKVVTCVGKFDSGIIDIMGIGQAQNQGMRKGVIVDIEETVSAISASLEEAERMAGMALKNAVIGIDGPHIESTSSKGVIAVSRTDGEISEQDVERVIQAARAIPNRPNREILHSIPINFVIDGQDVVKDPLGMSAIRLEVDTQIISTSTNAIKNLERCVEQSGISPIEIIFSPMATAKVLLSKRQMEIGVILIDIGAASTSYAIFEEGDLIHCGVIPIGSAHITNDIAIGLRTSIEIAEVLKVKYGFALPDKVSEKDEVQLKSIDKREDGPVSVKYISEIIEARLKEILLIVRSRLEEIDRDGTLPAGVILTGGGCKLEGIIELSKETLRLPAQIGTPLVEVNGLVDKVDDPVYATSVGLMLWGKDKTAPAFQLDSGSVSGILDKAKGFLKQFMP